MHSFAIYTEVTCDLPTPMAEQYHLHLLPMGFTINDKEYRHYHDYRQLSMKDFYDALRQGKLPTTSQVTVNDFLEAWEKSLQSGQDILYIGFSNALSGTIQSGFLAQKLLTDKYPDRTILCIDTLAGGGGEGLLVLYAARLREEGKTLQEVYQWLMDNRLKMVHLFTVDDLNHLKRGGRISAAAALLGSAIGIKPLLHVNDEGKLLPIGKARGRKKALKDLVEKMKTLYDASRPQTIFINHGDCEEDALLLGSLIKESFSVDEILYAPIGPIVGSHTGPGALNLFFLGSQRL